MKRSIKVARIFNIPIEINYSWFIILGLVIFTLGRGYFPSMHPNLPIPGIWAMAILSALLLFASLLAHELSHSIVAIRNNLPIHGITLFIFGGVAHLEQDPAAPIVEFKMAAAGPAMSFFLSLLFFGLTQVLYNAGAPDYCLSITNYLFIINLMVGMFNLIPGFPLDGGRILRSVIWFFSKDIKKATGIAAAIGKGFAFFLIVIGLLNLINSYLISGVWFIFVGFFLQEAAETSYRQVVMRKMLSGFRVEELMTRAIVTVPASLTLDRLVDEYFFKYRYASFPVIEDDLLAGLVILHAIKGIEREKWPHTTVKEIALPINAQMVIEKESEVMTAMARMTGNGLGRLLVTDGTKLIGLISQKDVLRLFEFKSAIEK